MHTLQPFVFGIMRLFTGPLGWLLLIGVGVVGIVVVYGGGFGGDWFPYKARRKGRGMAARQISEEEFQRTNPLLVIALGLLMGALFGLLFERLSIPVVLGGGLIGAALGLLARPNLGGFFCGLLGGALGGLAFHFHLVDQAFRTVRTLV